MAVTILEEPADVALAYNPVRFKVQAEQLYEDGGGAGSYSKMEFGAYTAGGNLPAIVADDSLSLVVFGSVIDFVFTDDPTPAPGKLPTEDATGGDPYSDVLKVFLETNHILFKNYVISVYSSGSVYIEAREKGGVYDMSVENENFTNTVNWVQTEVTAGEVPFFVTNRFVRGDLYVEDVYKSDKYNYYGNVEQQIIDSDKLWFDFSSKMRAYVDKVNEMEAIANGGLVRLEKTNKRYYVVFTEYDAGGYSSVNEFEQSSTLRFIKAGVKSDEWKIFPDVVTSYLKDKEKVMSWRPTRREISPGQSDHLYYLNTNAATTTVSAIVKFYFTDNTTETKGTDTEAGVLVNETFCLDVSHKRMTDKATIPSGESVRGYECWFTDQGGVRLTESVFFTVRPRTYYDRYFFYESSWGTFETLKTESLHSYGIQAKKEEVLAFVGAEASYNKGDIKDIVHEFVEQFKGSTGGLSDDDALVMADFIISENKYLQKGARLINITVPTSSVEPHKDDGYPQGFKFTYKRATTQQKFSALIGVRANEGLLGESVEDSEDETLQPG